MVEEKIAQRAQQAIAEKVFPGCVVGVVRANGERAIILVGTIIYDSAEKVLENTIYDVASITKAIPTASLALMLITEGKLSLNARVREHIPELRNDYDATIEDLLRHRVSGPRMSQLPFKTFEEIRTHIFEQGFSGPPSAKKAFTNLPAYLLGIIVERVGGASLPALAQQYFFDPLKMTDTTFFPHDVERIAPTEIVDGKEVRGIVHDESARVFALARRAVGHAGLFSTVPDLLNFLQHLLMNDGFTKPVIEGAQKGLGWQVDEEWMGKHRADKTFGKTGFAGTSIVCDIERGIGLAILSNRTYPHRPPDTSAINAFRKDIADIVLGPS